MGRATKWNWFKVIQTIQAGEIDNYITLWPLVITQTHFTYQQLSGVDYYSCLLKAISRSNGESAKKPRKSFLSSLLGLRLLQGEHCYNMTPWALIYLIPWRSWVAVTYSYGVLQQQCHEVELLFTNFLTAQEPYTARVLTMSFTRQHKVAPISFQVF